MRAATEGNLPRVMPQGNLVEVLSHEARQGSPGKLMVESSPSRQRRPPCKTNQGMTDEAADAPARTYLRTRPCTLEVCVPLWTSDAMPTQSRYNGLKRLNGSRMIMHDTMTSIRSIRCMAHTKKGI